MMNRDRGSKVRRPRVINSASSAKLDTPTQSLPLVRSNTLPVNHTVVPRAPRNNSLGLPDKEKARSDDGFHSDSDKDSNQSANSNISIHSSKSYLSRTPSIKSNVVVKVRSKSSLGTMSENSSSDKSKIETLDIATLNRQLQADMQAEEARKNRKIEDLEISIQSLTRFNAELEATNKKQAKEIQELRRKLHINNSFMSIYGSDDDDDDEVSIPLSEIDLAEIEKDNDTRFRRICMVIDGLVRDANEALAYTSKIGSRGSKVLTNVQLESNKLGPYMDESGKIPDSDPLPNSLSSKNSREPEPESNSPENGTITNKKKSNSSVVNEQILENDPKIKLTTEKYSTNSTTVQLSNLPFAESVEEKNKGLPANLERARTVASELLSLEKQDNNVNNSTFSNSHNSERKGLGLLLPIQNGHSPHKTHSSINGSDSSQPSPRMILLYELQESLGIGDSESTKYLKENRRSLPIMSSGRIHFNIISPSEENQEESDIRRPSIRGQIQSNKLRRRSSPNFRTPSTFSPMIGITDHATSSLVKKDVLNSLPHGSDVEKRSLWASSLVFLTTPFRTD